MAFNGSGTFLRIANWVNDATGGILIRADRHDAQDNDFAAGLTQCITKDGQTSPIADIPMNGHKLINLGAPVNNSDAATKAYADTPKPYNTGVEIAGADANGVVNFSSLTGANGLSFKGADLSWLARLATAAGPGTPPVPPATLNRLVLNTKPDGTGSDVVTVNDDGSITTAGAVATGNITTTGTIVASGTITAGSMHISKAAAGNVHFWLRGPNDESRGLMYSAAASAGDLYLQTGNGQQFTHAQDGQFYAPNNLHAGGAYLQTDGNVVGSVYGGALTTYVYNTADSRGLAWANDRIQNLQYRKVSQGTIGASGTGAGTTIVPGGAVVTGMQTNQYYPVSLVYKYLQIYDPVRGWVGFSEA